MRSTDPAAAHDARDDETARVARAVVEQLEMLWERGREAVPSPPVSTSQLRVLYLLDQRDGMNARGLGELLGAAPSSVSRLCDRLEALGYLGRSAGASDRRQVTLRITPLGRGYLSGLRAHREKELATTLATLTHVERDALRIGLAAFRHATEARARPAPERSGDRVREQCGDRATERGDRTTGKYGDRATDDNVRTHCSPR